FLIGFLGRSLGCLPNPIFTFPLGCFDAGSAGVGDLACFDLLAIVEETLNSTILGGLLPWSDRFFADC
ncbi:MAG: hypothetical protein VW076_04025, partial [Synechococcus sp.]